MYDWGWKGYFRMLFILGLLSWPMDGLGEHSEKSIGDRFNGEVLRYDFDFWILSRTGEGSVTFRSLEDGKFLAVYEGKTLGLIGWISRYRFDRYRSTMGMIDQGKRLIPLRFEEEVTIGEKTRKRTTRFDYGARKISVETQRESKVSREELEIPPGVLYDDPMTALYNLRSGVYGMVEPGKVFSILTVPRKRGPKTLRISVAHKEEEERKRSAESDKGEKDFYIRAHLDKEMVGSIHGLVEGWFSADLVPISAVAKDVFLFGDLRGILRPQGLGPKPPP